MPTLKRLPTASFGIVSIILVIILTAIPYYEFPKYIIIALLFSSGFSHSLYLYINGNKKHLAVKFSLILYLIILFIPIGLSINFIFFKIDAFSRASGWGIGYESVPYPYHIYHLFSLSFIVLWIVFFVKSLKTINMPSIKNIKCVKLVSFLYFIHCLFFLAVQLIYAMRYHKYYNTRPNRGFMGSEKPIHEYGFLFDWPFWVIVLAPILIVSVSTIALVLVQKRKSFVAT